MSMQHAESLPKFCRCGCGQRTSGKKYYRKGLHVSLFLPGHHMYGKMKEKNHNWKGGFSTVRGTSKGWYVLIHDPTHTRANNKGYVMQHILIVERAMGKPLPLGAEAHHVNEIPNDNRNSNLVVCQNHAYHILLHQRRRALQACGHAAWRKCRFCKKYDDPVNLHIWRKTVEHAHCARPNNRKRYQAAKERTQNREILGKGKNSQQTHHPAPSGAQPKRRQDDENTRRQTQTAITHF